MHVRSDDESVCQLNLRLVKQNREREKREQPCVPFLFFPATYLGLQIPSAFSFIGQPSVLPRKQWIRRISQSFMCTVTCAIRLPLYPCKIKVRALQPLTTMICINIKKLMISIFQICITFNLDMEIVHTLFI